MFRVCLLFALVACALAVSVTIDSFTTNTPPTGALVYDPSASSTSRAPQSASTNDPNVLGGSRDIYITAAGGFRSAQTPVTQSCQPNPQTSQTSNPTLFAFRGDVSSAAGLQLSNPTVACNAAGFSRYDGAPAPLTAGCDYYAANCVPEGQLGLNLASATSVTVRAGADLGITYFAVYLYSTEANWCGVFQNIAGGTSLNGQVYDFPLSNFKASQNPPASSGLTSQDFPQTCNLGAISAIEIHLVGGTNWDQNIFSISYNVPDSVTISGSAFDDCNCVGSTSSPKNGVSVSLFSGSSCTGSAVQTTTTSGSGSFSFGSISPGTYTVCATSASTLCSSSSSSVTRAFSTSDSSIRFFYSVQSGVLTCPGNRDLTCGEDTSVATLGSATISQGCGTGAAVTQNPDNVVNVPCTAPRAVIQTITRSWSAGGQTCQQVITIRDNGVTPVLTNVPANVVIDCNAANPTDRPGVTGSCSNPVVVVSDSATGNGQCDVNTCSRSTVSTRTFTPQDACGNVGTSATQTITRNCATSCPQCPSCPTATVPVPTSAPRPVVGPLNCKFICDDADSSAVATMVSLLVVVVLAVFAL